MTTKENILLSRYTTLKVGGPARYFKEVKNENELIAAVRAAQESGLRWYLMGGGSNLVPADAGFRGTIIKVDCRGIERDNETVRVKAGENLFEFIKRINGWGLAGMERMAGIPGTVGGAIYGNAGAYGQEIKDCLVSVRIFNGRQIRELPIKKLRLSYRSSVFKRHKEWIMLDATFRFRRVDSRKLIETSKEIVALREQKYPPRLRCPGSFFKNIVLADLPARNRRRLTKEIPEDKIMYGKIPAGYLLEAIGAKGMRRGGIKIAPYHANLFYNTGQGTAAQIKELARVLKKRAHNRFGIILEEEVQYLPY